MKNQNHIQKGLSLMLLLTAAVVLSACGSSKSVSSDISSGDYASRNNPGTQTSDSGLLAECNFIPENTSNIEGRMTTYYDPTTGAFDSTHVRLKFDRVPLNILTGNNIYIQIFRWYADANGKKTFNSQATGFYFQLRSGKQYLNASPLKTISKATLQNIITDKGLAAQGVTMNNFFEKVLLILEGVDMTYDGLSFAVYDSNKGSSALAAHDALIPAFSANPNTYALNHEASVLQSLHPFWSSRSSGWSDDQYRQASMNYCIP
jgi:hypothetical protein